MTNWFSFSRGHMVKHVRIRKGIRTLFYGLLVVVGIAAAMGGVGWIALFIFNS